MPSSSFIYSLWSNSHWKFSFVNNFMSLMLEEMNLLRFSFLVFFCKILAQWLTGLTWTLLTDNTDICPLLIAVALSHLSSLPLSVTKARKWSWQSCPVLRAQLIVRTFGTACVTEHLKLECQTTGLRCSLLVMSYKLPFPPVNTGFRGVFEQQLQPARSHMCSLVSQCVV